MISALPDLLGRAKLPTPATGISAAPDSPVDTILVPLDSVEHRGREDHNAQKNKNISHFYIISHKLPKSQAKPKKPYFVRLFS